MAGERAHELLCERTILEAAQIAGWRRHGERPARDKKGYKTPIKGEAGWPDLILAKGAVLIAAELKRWPREPDPEQVLWLERFEAVPGCRALVLWVPDEMDEFNAQLFARRFVWRQLVETLAYPG